MKKELTFEGAKRTLRKRVATDARERNAIFADFAAVPLMAWGAIWAFCHLNGYWFIRRGKGILGFHPDSTGSTVTMLELGITFICAIVIFGLRHTNSPRSDEPWFDRVRAPFLVVVWFVFHMVASRIYGFEGGMRSNAYDSLYWMLLILVYGFWFSNGILLSVALVTSTCTLVGYGLMPDQYHLWVGIGGGGALFLGGLYACVNGIRCRVGADAGKSMDVKQEGLAS